MTIYISHSTKFDYQKELYLPIRTSPLNQLHTFLLPHEEEKEPFNIKQLFHVKHCDLVIAEVSYPSTGQGIELGWADAYHIPVACIHKREAEISNSLQVICNKFLSYGDLPDMIGDITTIIKQYEN